MKKQMFLALLLTILCIPLNSQQNKIIKDVVRKSTTKITQQKAQFPKKTTELSSKKNEVKYQPKANMMDAVQIGTAPNIFTQLSERCRTVDADPNLNAVSFIHRNSDDGDDGTPYTSSQYRYDISLDGGISFTSNIGPLNPATPGQNVPNGQGRYPQGIIYSPDGTTANAKLIYKGTTFDGVSGTVWDGFVAGSANLTDGTNFSQNNFLIPDGAINASLTKGLPGEFWSCDVFMDNSSTQTDLVLYKGILNGNNVDWQIYLTIPASTFKQNPDGSGSALADPLVAFSDDGMNGYLMVGGGLASDIGNIAYNPLIWMTEDGGANWTGPITTDLDNLGGYADTFAYVHNGNIGLAQADQFPGPLSLSYAGSDIIVDKNNDLHIGCAFQSVFYDSDISAFSPFATSAGSNFIVDLFYDKSENAWQMFWPDPATAGVAQVTKFQDTIIFDGNRVSDIRLSMSKDPASEKIFITYADDVDGLGLFDQTHRDLYGWGLDINTCLTTDVRNLTGNSEEWYGNALFHSTAPRTLPYFSGSPDTYSIPTVFTEIFNPFDQLAQVQFWYYQGAYFEEFDFAFTPIKTAPLVEEETCQLSIPMPYAGWHLISSYCRPADDSIENVFSPIVNEIIQVKDLVGNVYVPAFNNFNSGLYIWDIESGYLVKTANPLTLNINGGAKVDINTESVGLYTGWNLIAYWLQGDADPIDVFNAIVTDVIQVKDLNGAYVPSFNNFNNMGNMSETKGYLVKMNTNNSLTYSSSNILPRPANINNVDSEKLTPKHFTKNIKPNPNTSTLLVLNDENNLLKEGDELGIFTTNDLLVGAFVYENDMMGGLIFGDDESEEGIDGILENDKYLFKVWSKSTNTESVVEMNFIEGSESYKKDDLCVVSFKPNSVTGVQQLEGMTISANPNPASSKLTFELNVNTRDHYTIEIYHTNGQLIDVITNKQFNIGQHQINYELEHLNNGFYIYKVSNGKEVFANKFTVLK